MFIVISDRRSVTKSESENGVVLFLDSYVAYLKSGKLRMTMDYLFHSFRDDSLGLTFSEKATVIPSEAK